MYMKGEWLAGLGGGAGVVMKLLVHTLVIFPSLQFVSEEL
jgi:hypothetical protein